MGYSRRENYVLLSKVHEFQEMHAGTTRDGHHSNSRSQLRYKRPLVHLHGLERLCRGGRIKPMSRQHEIDGIHLHLSQPHEALGEWIGQQEILRQLLACWIVVDEKDLPLTPRLIGTPGIGKTALAMAGAQVRKQELFIYQCTSDTRPEDLLVTPVLAESGKIAYHASPLVTAMIRGGVCILDEGNRMNEKSWARLAPLSDHRRYVESIVAGITIHASRDFRCA